MTAEATTAIVGRLVGMTARGSALVTRWAAWSLGAAAVIALVAALTLPLSGTLTLALWALLSLLGALPGLVLLVFGYGLRRVSEVPSEFVESAQSLLSEALPPSPGGGSLRTFWGLSGYLLRIRGTLLDRGAWFAEAALLLRLGHPLVLIAVVISMAASVVLIPCAALALVIMAF